MCALFNKSTCYYTYTGVILLEKNCKELFPSDSQKESMTTETLENDMNTMPARMLAVIKTKGGNTNDDRFFWLCANKDNLVDNKM